MLAVAVNASAQKVTGKLAFQKGQKIQVVTNTNMTTEMPMGEMTGSNVNTEVYEVKDASAASATLERRVTGMKINFSVMGQEKTFDSDKPEDLKDDMGQALKKVLDARQEFTVNATGMVTAVKDDGKKEEGGDMMSAMMSQMNTGAVPTAGSASVFRALPDYAVGKGDSWTDTASQGGNRSKTVYTVKDITADEVVLDFVTDGTVDTKQEMMGMSIDVKGTVKSSGTLTADKSTGLLKQKITTMQTETAASVAGQDINSTGKVTSVITVRTL